MTRGGQAQDLTSLLRAGTIVEIDLAAARCRVAYGDPDSDDGDAETGWIAWLAGRAGETRIWSPPSEGEQVLLLCPDGQLTAAVALPGLWRDLFPPPGSEPADLIQWADGARVLYDPDASEMQITLPAGGTLEVDCPGGVTINADRGITLRGDVTIEGDVNVDGRLDVAGDVVGEGISLASHRHGGVQAGGGFSSTPT